MKRGIVVILIFCLAAMAGAALQLDVTDGKVIVSGKLEIDMILGLAACDGATLSNFVIGPAAPSITPIIIEDPILIEFPEGCDGKWQFFGVYPGEEFKEGVYWTADVTPAIFQETRYWEEKVFGDGCPEGWWFIRTFTEIIEIEKGFVSLIALSADNSQAALIDEVSLYKQTITTTCEDHVCIPEPMTSSLLGLGIALIRRRNGIK
jgi:hypothetical protein